MKTTIEENRRKSLEVFAEARRKALHAAYYKTPIASIIPNNAAAAGSSSSGVLLYH